MPGISINREFQNDPHLSLRPDGCTPWACLWVAGCEDDRECCVEDGGWRADE